MADFCTKIPETKKELYQLVLTEDIQNMNRNLSTMEKQKTEMERTYSKQNTKISTLTKKLRQVSIIARRQLRMIQGKY